MKKVNVMTRRSMTMMRPVDRGVHARPLRIWAACLGAALMVPFAAMPASAQSTKDRVRTLEAQVSELEAAAAGLIASTQRMDRLEEEVRTLTGRVEELTYKLERANAQIDSMSALLAGEGAAGGGFTDTDAFGTYGDTGRAATGGPVDLTGTAGDFGDAAGSDLAGSDAGGDGFGDGARQAAPQGPSGVSGVSLPFDPNAAFEYADAFLLSSDYARAAEAFSLFVETFPDHPRAADAQLRIGEIALATGDNPAAADAFIKHIQAYPNDPRAAEAYVKLGSAFSRMGETGEACKVLGAMRGKFPTVSTELAARAERERTRAACR